MTGDQDGEGRGAGHLPRPSLQRCCLESWFSFAKPCKNRTWAGTPPAQTVVLQGCKPRNRAGRAHGGAGRPSLTSGQVNVSTIPITCVPASSKRSHALAHSSVPARSESQITSATSTIGAH